MAESFFETTTRSVSVALHLLDDVDSAGVRNADVRLAGVNQVPIGKEDGTNLVSSAHSKNLRRLVLSSSNKHNTRTSNAEEVHSQHVSLWTFKSKAGAGSIDKLRVVL